MIDTSSFYDPDGLTVLVIIADWCPYSLLVRPAAERVAERIGCELRLVDIEKEPKFMSDCNVNTVPTVLLYRSGTFVGRWEGQTNPEDIPEFFENVCLTNQIPVADKP